MDIEPDVGSFGDNAGTWKRFFECFALFLVRAPQPIPCPVDIAAQSVQYIVRTVSKSLRCMQFLSIRGLLYAKKRFFAAWNRLKPEKKSKEGSLARDFPGWPMRECTYKAFLRKINVQSSIAEGENGGLANARVIGPSFPPKHEPRRCALGLSEIALMLLR